MLSCLRKNIARYWSARIKTLLKEVLPFALYHASERRRQATAFLENVENNYELRDKISTANNDNDLVKIAKEAGYSVSADDVWLYEDRTFKRKAGMRGWYSTWCRSEILNYPIAGEVVYQNTPPSRDECHPKMNESQSIFFMFLWIINCPSKNKPVDRGN